MLSLVACLLWGDVHLTNVEWSLYTWKQCFFWIEEACYWNSSDGIVLWACLLCCGKFLTKTVNFRLFWEGFIILEFTQGKVDLVNGKVASWCHSWWLVLKTLISVFFMITSCIYFWHILAMYSCPVRWSQNGIQNPESPAILG